MYKISRDKNQKKFSLHYLYYMFKDLSTTVLRLKGIDIGRQLCQSGEQDTVTYAGLLSCSIAKQLFFSAFPPTPI